MRLASFFRNGIATLFVAACGGAAAGAASGVNANMSITADMLLKMPPQEIAQLVGDSDKVWVAKTFYSDRPLGGGLSAITLFAMPEPLAENICTVELKHISLDAIRPEHNTAESLPAYHASEKMFESLFVVAAPPDGTHGLQHDTLTDRCHHTAIRSDFMARSGASNVFTSASSEIATAGAKIFGIVVAMARSQRKPLPFSLECDSPMEHFCEDSQNKLAKLSATDFESANRCIEAGCVRLQGFDGHFGWSVDIYSDIESESPNVVRITRVKMTFVPEPVI